MKFQELLWSMDTIFIWKFLSLIPKRELSMTMKCFNQHGEEDTQNRHQYDNKNTNYNNKATISLFNETIALTGHDYDGHTSY